MISDVDMVQKSLIRSAIYRQLANGFRYPTEALYESFRNGEFLSGLFQSVALVPHLESLVDEVSAAREKVEKEMAGVAFCDFEPDYVGMFDVGFPEPPCPPYEGVYREGERISTMMAVSEFYRHFGLAMGGEGTKELPDYICAELEFLHFLTFKEFQARQENDPELLNGYLLAQRDFLERHLARWLPKFCERVRSAGEVPFYPELAGLTAEFVANEFAWVGVQVQGGVIAKGRANALSYRS